jgi:ABC-type Zn2+ transport system substrate-binding protein/surface adhesin
MKSLVEDILGIRNNSLTIGNSVTREVEGMMSNRRPFINTSLQNTQARQGTEVRLKSNTRGNILTSQEEGVSVNHTNDNINHKKHSHRHKHRHSHRHGHKDGHKHSHRHGHTK